jgi:hypothetical protein
MQQDSIENVWNTPAQACTSDATYKPYAHNMQQKFSPQNVWKTLSGTGNTLVLQKLTHHAWETSRAKKPSTTFLGIQESAWNNQTVIVDTRTCDTSSPSSLTAQGPWSWITVCIRGWCCCLCQVFKVKLDFRIHTKAVPKATICMSQIQTDRIYLMKNFKVLLDAEWVLEN